MLAAMQFPMGSRPRQPMQAACVLAMMLTLLIGHPAFARPRPQISENAAQADNNRAILPKTTSMVLDRVVAVVEETAILASDVDEEMRFAALQPNNEPASDSTPQQALDRLIDRALINQQRILQPGLTNISQDEVNKAVEDLRKTIPACVQYQCANPAGWLAFLQAHEFTVQEVQDRVRERLEILKFMDLRFGAAVRVSRQDVQKYYDETLRPELLSHHAAVPELKAVTPRIREILRQQRISAMIDEWLKGLHSEGHVQILDSAYESGPASSSGSTGVPPPSDNTGADVVPAQNNARGSRQ